LSTFGEYREPWWQDPEPVPDATDEAATSRAADFEFRVSAEMVRREVRAEAERRMAAAIPRPPFDAQLLADVADVEHQWRVAELLQVLGRMLLVAQRKTGKTTLALGLIRTLLLGGSFLGRFEVEPITGRVAFLNYEVSAQQLARWAREVGIPADRLLLVNLRGCSNPLADPDQTRRLAQLLRDHEAGFMVVDPFGRAFTGTSQNDAGEIAGFLARLDTFATDAGISEYVLTAHAGWDGERSRGSSALEDWADVVLMLTRDKDDDSGRYLRAFGRDVEVEEDRLEYDPVTRRLSMSGAGSRKVAAAGRRTDALVEAVVEAVTVEPGSTVGRLEELVREAGHGFQRGDVGRACRSAVAAGHLRQDKGARNSLRNYPTGQYSRVLPNAPAGMSGSTPDPSYRDGSTPTTTRTLSGPGLVDFGTCQTCSQPLTKADQLAGSNTCTNCEGNS
jgi:hypothetical protein